MAVWLPRLSTDRLIRSGAAPAEPRALVVYAKVANAFVVTAVDARARRCGLAPDMPLADARAMHPHLAAYEADPVADRHTLEDIARWCERFTPAVTIDPPHGLFLDIVGCAHLFGGEADFVHTVQSRLTSQGFANRVAIAPTPGAAWAFARFGAQRMVNDAGLRAALAPLPVAALRLNPAAAALLKRLGLKTIGHVLDAPRQPFAARAGEAAMRRLDQALGRAGEALSPYRPLPALYALRRLAEPLTTLDAVLIAVGAACEDLVAQMHVRGAGARLLQLSLFGLDAGVRNLEIGLSRPTAHAPTMLRLLRERLSIAPETIDAAFGVEAVRLDAVEIAPIVLHATDLAPASGRDCDAEARLIDTLSVRLGADRITRPALRSAHVPERVDHWTPAQQAPPGAGRLDAPPADDAVMRRPLQLFAHAQPVEAMASVPDGPPLQFRWRRVLHEVVRAEGPERIAPDWLTEPHARTRDYYRVEDRAGQRYWLYREGLYGDADTPRWYLHGLFA
jgi:protein ImuB